MANIYWGVIKYQANSLLSSLIWFSEFCVHFTMCTLKWREDTDFKYIQDSLIEAFNQCSKSELTKYLLN